MAAKKSARRAVKKAGKKAVGPSTEQPRKQRAIKRRRHSGGPAEWIMPMMEEVYSQLRPKEEIEGAPPKAKKVRVEKADAKARGKKGGAAKEAFTSTYQ